VMRRAIVIGALTITGIVGAGGRLVAQEPAAPQEVSAADLQAAIDNLGKLDYDTRMNASRTIRRTPPVQAVPALLAAANGHPDGYVRYRALVLLTGFNDSREREAMRDALTSPNDRLRTVAYSYFEHHPDPGMGPALKGALDTELAEFVRPALVRALAALAEEHVLPGLRPALVREVGRGEDFFRSAVIEALGDYKATYAFDAIAEVAKQDGPLQDDAAIALGQLGDPRALEILASLQQSSPRERQPSLAAAICRLGVNCDSHEGYLIDTLKFASGNPGFQDLARGAAAGLGVLGVAGRATAVNALFDIGGPSLDPTRAPIALALGTVALRNTPLMLSVLEARPEKSGAIQLLGEAFDMLEEDLDKERFFAFVRHEYWSAAEASARRELMQTLITDLEF
jgi:HEAT repeat protein